MTVSLDQFRKWPKIPREIRQFKLAWEIYEALLRHPSSVEDLSRILNRPLERVAYVLNQLMRTGFVGFHLAPKSKKVLFYWAQTTEGEPALRNR